MAVTVQQLEAAAQTLLTAYAKVTPKIDEALSLIQGVDPCSANAKANLDKSKVIRDQGASIFRGEVSNALRAYNSLFEQSDGAAREAGKSLNQKINSTQDSIVAKNELVKLSQTSFAEKISKCPGATAAPATAPAPAATIPPPATPAPGDPKTNLVGSADGDSTKGANASVASSVASSTSARSSANQDTKPGKRLYNPLAKFPTYTYNLSLYMVTPKAYDRFVQSGRLQLDLGPESGAVIVAQTGGVDASKVTRGAGFSLDYYIDNLRITTATSGKDTLTATNTTEIAFTITEPYGFSFISNLKACADDLIAKSKEEGLENLDNATRQFFILGIRFTGFNNDGTPASSKDDPLFERFYDIMFTGISFKLDNKATNYNITAVSMPPGTAFGVKRGIFDTVGTLRGTTVYEVLQNMMDQMNRQSEELVKGKNIKPNKYSFKFMGEGFDDSEASQKSSPIFSSLMKSETEIGKSKLVGSVPDTTYGKTPQDQGKPNPIIQEISIPAGTPILQVFSLIISRSSYIENAFKQIQTSALENNNKKTNGETTQTTDSQAKIRWYNVSAECTNAKYSKELADFTWDIKYVFTTYETPVVTNPYSNLGIEYYGPHKRYDYWFTGQNSEILNYTQNLDNTFFNVALNPTDQNLNSDPSQTIPQAPKPQDAEKTGTQNQQQDMKKAYITSLFDPQAYANATIKILGDPDFLMPESTSTIEDVYNQFYGPDSYTINPNGGQVFIEIDFKEPQDYNFASEDNITFKPTGTGLMSMNNKIKFWEYPDAVAELVKGVSYQLITVKSSFSQGKFEQDLTCVINIFPGYDKNKAQASREASLTEVQVTGRRSTAAGGQGQTGPGVPGGGTGTTTGLLQDPTGRTGRSSSGPATTSSPTATGGGQAPTVSTSNGPVANDDGNKPTAPAPVTTTTPSRG